MRKVWYVYVAECGDGTLYTGVTTDLARRMGEHASGRGAKYTRGRGGVRLRAWEACATKGRALSREAAIKRMARAVKRALPAIDGIRPAAPGDLAFIQRTIARLDLDAERVSHEQFVIATVGRSRAGFARIKPYRACFELGSVAVLPRFRDRGVGASLVRCLLERFPSRAVWITTDLRGWFERFGFRESRAPAELRAKLRGITHKVRRRGIRALVYRRQS